MKWSYVYLHMDFMILHSTVKLEYTFLEHLNVESSDKFLNNVIYCCIEYNQFQPNQ